MIWSKTDAGRTEMQTRALVKERAQRNLLLLIDGIKTEEMLLVNVAGVTPEDFRALAGLNLIVPVASSLNRPPLLPVAGERIGAAVVMPDLDTAPLDYPQFTAALTQLISSELGLRGFTLTLAVEKAGSIEELRDVANRALDLIRERKGLAVADKARRTLYGG